MVTVNNVWKRCLKAREDLKGPLSVRKGSGTREAEGVGRRGEGARGTGTAMKEGGRADGMKGRGSERDGGGGGGWLCVWKGGGEEEGRGDKVRRRELEGGMGGRREG